MNKRLWIVFGIVVLAVVGLAIYATNNKSSESTELDPANFTWDQIITENNVPEGTSAEDARIVADTVDGKKDSDVVLIEWMNFQCSACQSLYHTIDDIYKEYSDRVAFVNRYLYLTGHPNGLAASVAAESAAKQGKYHEMFNELFSNAETWNNATIDTRETIFKGFAEAVGVDIDQWLADYKDYENNGIKKRLDFQNQLGLGGGITGTPYIMINGENVKGTKDTITAALDKALGN